MTSWWTDERVALLRKKWEEGVSAGQIGALMGCTRNAVIGKVTRMGLGRRITNFRLAGKLGAQRRRINQRREEAKTATERKTSRVAELLKSEGFVPRDDDVVMPVESRKSMETLTDHCCRWPVGDPLEKDFYFCGQPRVPGIAYCVAHVRKAYVAPTPKKKKSDNVVPLRREREEVE